ncbi:RibD family protein [Bifidobacterium phasiani]|uniref:Dihydrofolate reductase family protein n=1 Tax=Bifidobacterium phasiani TaxID=2834431 RepID=A0ABS6W7G4_9BIFI|nr:dihydrofolate reductase family protein [Bifidobacterium phasiani]MBW3082436.1 dihydrofolate reductase family protein [Bifidobacterium phasiani]
MADKPYVICHMMASVDGRIDCGMTIKLRGNDEYYATLDALDAPTRVSGRVTARTEMALSGEFRSEGEALGAAGFGRAAAADGYNIVVDTKGTLLWPDQSGNPMPLLVLTSEQVGKDYLAYLDERHISWIACGDGHIDLVRACEILADEFGVERMAVVGGGHINAGFLDAGLLNEVSVLIGPGIDGRGGMVSVFDGLPMDREPIALKLESVTPYDDGAVWLRYSL